MGPKYCPLGVVLFARVSKRLIGDKIELLRYTNLEGKNVYLELDVWIPQLKLAFEYQEKHHYMHSSYTCAHPLKEYLLFFWEKKIPPANNQQQYYIFFFLKKR